VDTDVTWPSMKNALPPALLREPRQHEVAFDCLVVAVEEARYVPGAASSALAGIEFRIADGGCVFHGRDIAESANSEFPRS
jgi:hypothetical protein